VSNKKVGVVESFFWVCIMNHDYDYGMDIQCITFGKVRVSWVAEYVLASNFVLDMDEQL